MSNTYLRQAPLATLAGALKDQQTRVLDVVAPAREITVDGGMFVLRGTEQVLSADGVTSADGLYVPTAIGEEGVAAKLDIPLRYLRRMRDEAVDLYDANVNGWLARSQASFLLRNLRTADGDGIGTMRAFLSPNYRTIDNFDVLLAALNGIKEAGVDSPRISADLSDRRMYVTVVAPEVTALAPELLKGYRSPFSGGSADDLPIVSAGFKLTNSETGNGSMGITPYAEVRVCSNGMTVDKSIREIHVGRRQEDGIVYSDDTRQANLDLVLKMTRDAVSTFLTPGYLKRRLDAMTEAAGVKVAKPQEIVTEVSSKLGFTEAQANDILAMFVQGGQMTAGGVMQAVTAAANVTASADDADDMQRKAWQALDLAAASAAR